MQQQTVVMAYCAGCRMYRACAVYRGIHVCPKDWRGRKRLHANSLYVRRKEVAR